MYGEGTVKVPNLYICAMWPRQMSKLGHKRSRKILKMYVMCRSCVINFAVNFGNKIQSLCSLVHVRPLTKAIVKVRLS